MTEYLTNFDIWPVIQVILIDLVLAGDNAIVVGMAAAAVDPVHRKKVIFLGIGLAVIMRIVFAALTMQLLGIVGLTFAGGLLLFWVCWKLLSDLQSQNSNQKKNGLKSKNIPAEDRKTVSSAIFQVAVADISMSLDNVLAVAGVAKDNITVLIIGLGLSVILMGIGASLIARVLERNRWVGYLGLLLILYVAIDMVWRGGVELGNYL